MNWNNPFSKRLYIILFVFLIGIGTGTAYAGVVVLPTITLGGNVDIIGEMTCTDCVDSPELEQFGSGRDISSVSDPGIGNCLIGEIRLFSGNFAPRGFLPAQGQLLSISEFSSLFSILGTTYGGDGRVNFGLPDLRNSEPNSTFFGDNDDVHYLICAKGDFPSRP